ncbi:MAG: YsaB family lipoprotein [Candidatus Dactylopiibacterium sp.]|nr:YsaB family lipoprotein [Candidatus Dactylopiibacterium sp.]
MKRPLALALPLLLAATTGAHAALPRLNAECPTGLSIHIDAGGPVYINGRQAALRRMNDNYYEARQGNATLSISLAADGTPSLSYTRDRANGICTLKTATAADAADDHAGAPRHAPAALAPAATPQGARAPVAPNDMAAFCRGEAAGQYGTRPRYVKSSRATREDGGYVMRGEVDKGREGISRFACRFDAQRRFIDVMALDSDGE